MRKYIWSGITAAVAAAFLSIYNAAVVNYGDMELMRQVRFGINKTTVLLFAVLFLIILICRKAGSDRIFRYRYAIAGAVFILCVALGISGSSIGKIAEAFGQQDHGLLFGVSRNIRSDEWALLTPMTWSQYLDPEGPFSYFSSVVRADRTDVFLEYGLPVASWLMIYKPYMLGYLFLPMANGLAFFWCSRFLALLMVSFEFGRLITKDRRKLAVIYSVLITLSPGVQWWFAVNGFVEMLIAFQLSLLCLDRYIQCGSRWKRMGHAGVITLCAGSYVLTMYPAWMVPLALVLLACAVWLLALRISEKKTVRLTVTDMAVIGFFLAVLAGTGWVVMSQSGDTIRTILGTAYPGQRKSNGGGQTSKFFMYMTDLWLAIKDSAPSYNTCELSYFISLTPAGCILYLRNRLRGGKRDGLSIALLLIGTILFVYIVFGLPSWLADITLLNRTVTYRAFMIFELVNTMLLIRGIALSRDLSAEKQTGWRSWLYLLISASLAAAGLVIIRTANPDWYSAAMLAVTFLLFTFLFFGSFSLHPRVRKAWGIALTAVSLVSGLLVNPVRVGLNDISEVPELRMVKTIVQQNPDGKWIVEGLHYPYTNYLLVKGARTINSTNVYPDLARWKMIDPDGKYENCYNRYAHIMVDYGENPEKFHLINEDQFKVWLNLEDLQKLGVDYIFTRTDFSEENGFVKLDQVGDFAVYQLDAEI